MHPPRSAPRAAQAFRPLARVAGCLLLLGLAAGGALGQELPPPSLPGITEPATTVPIHGTSPGGAFLRAVLLPGWGHASIGAYRRGAFYFLAEGATAFVLVKSDRRLREAEARILFRENVLRTQLATQGVVLPEEIQAAFDEDETLQDLTDLQEARRQQREDWTALGIFLVFLSGADAYVSAHLQRFPAPIEVNAAPAGNGRMEFSVGISLPR